ncbi:MAG: aminodeoxychorismate/anthranilate synthase component II [Candidatus Nanopelagicales bacterium]|nr:aminodeoxychorismate/anthranilate synthase component II [Candidatus Nanopelagicales bacterium]
MTVLVIDNYDSFVYNLVQYLGELKVECDVHRNDQIGLDDVTGYQGVLLSPGPGTPDQAGICMDLIRRYAGQIPIFGVCLGHQAIAEVYGATVSRAPELLHGKTSLVHHDGRGVFEGLPDPMTATRYHSLAVEPDTVPAALEVSARTDSGVIMGLRHRELAVEGVQFHPESVLTEGGHRMLANWLVACGDEGAVARSEGLSPVVG